MNVNATIQVQLKQDVINIPVSAIKRGNIVYVKSTGAKSSATPRPNNSQSGSSQGRSGSTGQTSRFGQVPVGFEIRRIETGVSNQDNIEVVSGLSEGEIVFISDTSANKSSPSASTAPSGGQTNRAPSGGFGRGLGG